jgi:hypothetical protein
MTPHPSWPLMGPNAVVLSMQVARRSVEPDPVSVARAMQRNERGDQPRLPPAPNGRRGTGSRAPLLWSEDKAMLRTGICSGAYDAPWQHSQDGFSQVARRLRPYLAAQHNMGMASGSSCNKGQRSTMQLIPGTMLLWCFGCGKCLMFAIMPDSESPGTIFELLYTQLPQPPELFMMDNGCNVHPFDKLAKQVTGQISFYTQQPRQLVLTHDEVLFSHAKNGVAKRRATCAQYYVCVGLPAHVHAHLSHHSRCQYFMGNGLT